MNFRRMFFHFRNQELNTQPTQKKIVKITINKRYCILNKILTGNKYPIKKHIRKSNFLLECINITLQVLNTRIETKIIF